MHNLIVCLVATAALLQAVKTDIPDLRGVATYWPGSYGKLYFDGEATKPEQPQNPNLHEFIKNRMLLKSLFPLTPLQLHKKAFDSSKRGAVGYDKMKAEKIRCYFSPIFC